MGRRCPRQIFTRSIRHDVERCGAISAINQKCVLWMGTLTPVRGLKEETAALMRQGRKFLPEEAIRIYDVGLPNLQTIHTEAYTTAFLSRKRIVSLFDSLELEKKDTVVMAGERLQGPEHVPEEPRRFLYVPNAMLSGDSDCTVLLTFDDIARRLTKEKVLHVPKCIMQSGRGPYTDITGVTLEQFTKKTGVRVKVLHKIDTRFANQQLYRNGSLNTTSSNLRTLRIMKPPGRRSRMLEASTCVPAR